MTIKSRTFGDIHIYLGYKLLEEREMDERDFNACVDLGNSMPKFIKTMLSNARFDILLSLLILIFKKMILRITSQSYDYEKYNILCQYLGTDFKYIKIVLGSKTAIIDMNNKTLYSTFAIVNQIFGTNQYDISESNVKDKIIADVGSLNGDFAILCVLLGAKKVFAFEPEDASLEWLKTNIRLNKMEDKIIPVKCSIGSVDDENKNMIKLDTFFKDGPIHLIKMDIEGNEADALMGATHIMQKYKPVITCSVYHRPCDDVNLPYLVKNNNPNYNIKINKYDEKDMYCD